MHTNFQEDWPEKKPNFFHLKIWCIVFLADCKLTVFFIILYWEYAWGWLKKSIAIFSAWNFLDLNWAWKSYKKNIFSLSIEIVTILVVCRRPISEYFSWKAKTSRKREKTLALNSFSPFFLSRLGAKNVLLLPFSFGRRRGRRRFYSTQILSLFSQFDALSEPLLPQMLSARGSSAFSAIGGHMTA